ALLRLQKVSSHRTPNREPISGHDAKRRLKHSTQGSGTTRRAGLESRHAIYCLAKTRGVNAGVGTIVPRRAVAGGAGGRASSRAAPTERRPAPPARALSGLGDQGGRTTQRPGPIDTGRREPPPASPSSTDTRGCRDRTDTPPPPRLRRHPRATR